MEMLRKSTEKDGTVSAKLFSLTFLYMLLVCFFSYSPRIIYSNIIEVSFHSDSKFRVECEKTVHVSLAENHGSFPSTNIGPLIITHIHSRRPNSIFWSS